MLPVAAAPIRDGVVVVADDRIAWVGSAAEQPELPPHAVTESLGDAILLPGLVNAHVHLDLTPFAGVLDAHSFFAWVRGIVDGSTVAMDADVRADSARWTVTDLLERGVTMFGDTGPTTAAFDALRDAGVRGVAYLETFGPDPAACDDAFADLQRRVGFARAHETSLVRIGVSPHAPYSVSDDLYQRVAVYARSENLPVAVHIAESADESDLVERGEGPFAEFLLGRRIAVIPRASSPIALLDAKRVLRTQPLCIHAVRANGDDVLRLADNGASVAHCPRSNRWFGHGDAPVSAFLERHVTVSLGTDSAASNDGLSLIGEAHDAADAALSSAERIALATHGGARALGRDDGTGTLAEGAPADLTAFRIRDVADADHDPCSHLIEQCVDERALLAMVAGIVRVRNGRAIGHDDALDERMEAHASRMRAWAVQAGWRASRAPF